MKARNTIYMLCVIGLMFIFACGPKAVKPEAQLDTPQHHVTNGNKFLELDRVDDALKEFVRAKELDPDFSPAHTGLGLVYGLQGEFEEGLSSLKAAVKSADNDQEKTDAYVGYIRLYTMGGAALDEDWLAEAQDYFERAQRLSPNAAAPYFYMGVANKQGLAFSEASTMFKKVLDLDTDFVAEADREYALVQRIERAMPGTAVGKKIALLDSITRADVAALFIEELDVDSLFRSRTPKEFDTEFKSPEEKFETGEYVKAAAATDISDHVLRADIETAMEIGIKGLQPGPDHKFLPDKKVTRAEFAMMIEDILVKVTGDASLGTKFIGGQSPFPDVRSDLPYYNAAMVCLTRNIMGTADPATGAFKPQALVSGADALLSIRQVKTQLNKL